MDEFQPFHTNKIKQKQFKTLKLFFCCFRLNNKINKLSKEIALCYKYYIYVYMMTFNRKDENETKNGAENCGNM